MKIGRKKHTLRTNTTNTDENNWTTEKNTKVLLSYKWIW